MAKIDFQPRIDFEPYKREAKIDFQPFLEKEEEEDSWYQKRVPESIKNALGGIETAGRFLWNIPAGVTAQGLGTLAGLGIGEDLPEALERGGEAAHRVSIPAATKQGELAEEAFGAGYDYVKRDVVAEAMLALD